MQTKLLLNLNLTTLSVIAGYSYMLIRHKDNHQLFLSVVFKHFSNNKLLKFIKEVK